MLHWNAMRTIVWYFARKFPATRGFIPNDANVHKRVMLLEFMDESYCGVQANMWDYVSKIILFGSIEQLGRGKGLRVFLTDICVILTVWAWAYAFVFDPYNAYSLSEKEKSPHHNVRFRRIECVTVMELRKYSYCGSLEERRLKSSGKYRQEVKNCKLKIKCCKSRLEGCVTESIVKLTSDRYIRILCSFGEGVV